MIIDTSNAPCGPGFLPGLRLSEGRFTINRKRSRFRGWGCRRQTSVRLRPPKCRRSGCPVRCGGLPRPASLSFGYTLPSRSLLLRPPGRGGAPRRARMCGRGCRWTSRLSALTALRVRKLRRDCSSGLDEGGLVTAGGVGTVPLAQALLRRSGVPGKQTVSLPPRREPRQTSPR